MKVSSCLSALTDSIGECGLASNFSARMCGFCMVVRINY